MDNYCHNQFKILLEKLGSIEAERFISLVLKEPFDYTKWQRTLWNNKSIKEISKKAMDYQDTKRK